MSTIPYQLVECSGIGSRLAFLKFANMEHWKVLATLQVDLLIFTSLLHKISMEIIVIFD